MCAWACTRNCSDYQLKRRNGMLLFILVFYASPGCWHCVRQCLVCDRLWLDMAVSCKFVSGILAQLCYFLCSHNPQPGWARLQWPSGTKSWAWSCGRCPFLTSLNDLGAWSCGSLTSVGLHIKHQYGLINSLASYSREGHILVIIAEDRLICLLLKHCPCHCPPFAHFYGNHVTPLSLVSKMSSALQLACGISDFFFFRYSKFKLQLGDVLSLWYKSALPLVLFTEKADTDMI